MKDIKVPLIIGIVASLFLLAIIIYKVGVATNLFGGKETPNNRIVYTKLLDYDDYKDIQVDNIDYIEVIRYTEGGDSPKTVTNRTEIENIYDSLSKVKIKGRTNMACEDNTTVYAIHLENGEKKVIEFECDWVIIKGKRYRIR